MKGAIAQESTSRLNGMASAELLIYSGLLIILLSTIFPIWRYSRKQDQIQQCRIDMITILNAGQRYFDDYAKWPCEFSGVADDQRYGLNIPNSHIFNSLRGIAGQGNPNHAVNPQNVIYLEPRSAETGRSGINTDGEWLDPWGNPYQVAVDSDLDYTCSIQQSRYPPQIGQGMLIWSSGPDRKLETRDDILSWALEE